MVPWQSIQGFSGATAVGSLVFVDWALITNAFADNLFPIINLYSKSDLGHRYCGARTLTGLLARSSMHRRW